MHKILVSGLINIEVTLQVEGFPIEYSPVRYPFFGINSMAAGVGYNITKALTTLGSQVNLLSLIGADFNGDLVKTALARDGLSQDYVLQQIPQTATAVILYDKQGKRQINTDLKDIQERTYPQDVFAQALAECALAVLCNINFSRPFLRLAKQAGKPVATDVHTIADLDDEYNRDFMASADILFISDEKLPCSPEEWAERVMAKYGPEIVVIGLGEKGALLAVRSANFMERFPAVYTRPVINTIGAGDALFSAFNYFYQKDHNPYEAIKKAIVFASYKIGERGAAEGFLTETQLNQL
jgi:ribokinase